MMRQFGNHYIQKYSHTLVINSVYEEYQPARSPLVLAFASWGPSRNKSQDSSPEDRRKRSRTPLFSPQASLRKYRDRSKCCEAEGEQQLAK